MIQLGLILAGVGVLAGVSAGLFGIGGGAIMVPALFYVFRILEYPIEISVKVAVATSVAVIVVNAVRSVRAHHDRGAVDWSLLWPSAWWRSWAVWIGAGAFAAAAILAPRLSGEALTVLFAGVAGVISLQFIFGRPEFAVRDGVPGGVAVPIGGLGIGSLSALMGIGGGSLTVPLMSLCGVPIHRAVGTASGIGLAIAAPAALGYVLAGWNEAGRPPGSLGYVNALGFAVVAAVSVRVVPFGAHLAHRLNAVILKRVFGMCLLAVAVNMGRGVL